MTELVEVNLLAERIHDAHRAGEALDATGDLPTLDVDSAYAVQHRLTELRKADGRRPVGYKLGYTSGVMRAQMGVDAPNYGPLYADMLFPSGSTVSGYLQPRVEPEIAFELAVDLAGTDLQLHEVAAAVGRVRASLEIVDSVWRDYRFTFEQNTADGSSAAGVVLGDRIRIDSLRCHELVLTLSGDGCDIASAAGTAAGGHPLLGVSWLCAQLARREGTGLRAGDVVITGGLTAAVPLARGSRIAATFGDGTFVNVRRSLEGAEGAGRPAGNRPGGRSQVTRQDLTPHQL